MKLFYAPTSAYVRKVLMVAHETGQFGEIELVPTAANPQQDDPALSAANPLAKIPSLVLEDGEVLFDSPVICEFLDARSPGVKIFPVTGGARWRALTLQALGDGIIDAALACRYDRLMRPAELTSPDWQDIQLGKVRRSLVALEEKATAGLGGATIGTLAVASALGYLDFRFAELEWRDGAPALADWFGHFAQRPSFQLTRPPAG